jgi:hypothetical protein
MSYGNSNVVPKKNPRNAPTALMKFLEWNMWGKGKKETSYRSSVFWHRDDIYYKGWKPVARCLHAPGHGIVMFKLADEGGGLWGLISRQSSPLPNERIFHVEDIGVMGVAEGLAMPGGKFLANLQKQLAGKAEFLVEAANGLSFNRCGEWVEAKDKPATLSGKPVYLHSDWCIDGRIKMIEDLGKTYADINYLFDLSWPAFDTATLAARYMDIVHAKAEIYAGNAPKRERAQLRKQGIEALGVGEERAAA